MLANIVFENFEKGGPVMWPILLVVIVAIAVVTERVIWWFIEARRRQPKKLDAAFDALQGGDYQTASRIARDSKDPLLRMVYHGLHHANSSLVGAMQVAEIGRAHV